MFVLIEAWADGDGLVVCGEGVAVSLTREGLLPHAKYDLVDDLPEDALCGWVKCYIREIKVV